MVPKRETFFFSVHNDYTYLWQSIITLGESDADFNENYIFFFKLYGPHRYDTFIDKLIFLIIIVYGKLIIAVFILLFLFYRYLVWYLCNKLHFNGRRKLVEFLWSGALQKVLVDGPRYYRCMYNVRPLYDIMYAYVSCAIYIYILTSWSLRASHRDAYKSLPNPNLVAVR